MSCYCRNSQACAFCGKDNCEENVEKLQLKTKIMEESLLNKKNDHKKPIKDKIEVKL